MGFFRNIWDETLAPPNPDSALRKLRRYNSLFAPSTLPPTDIPPPTCPVSRCITILPINGLSTSSSPSFPSGSTTPASPFSGRDFKKLTPRKSTADAMHPKNPKSPTGYDWIVLTSLDR